MTVSSATATRCLGVVVFSLWAAGCSKRAAAPEPTAAASHGAAAHAPLDVPMTAPRLVADLERTHVKVSFSPETDPSLGYEVVVPKDWTFARPPASAGADAVISLGSAVGPAGWGSPAITMSATKPAFEIPIDAWLRDVFAHGGYSTAMAHWFPGPEGLYFEMAGTRVHDGAEEVRRTSVRADGGHVFTVTCLAPREHWDQVKETCWVAHSSLHLKKKTGQSRLETWLTAEGKRPDFRMAYPASWSATPVPRAPEGISAVDVRLTDAKQEKLLAYVQVKARRLDKGEAVPPLDRLASRTLEKLAGIGFSATGAPAPLTEDDDPRAAAVPGWLGGFSVSGHSAGSDATARLGFAHRDGVLLTWLAISPTAHDDPMVALRAQRAFEIARATAAVD